MTVPSDLEEIKPCELNKLLLLGDSITQLCFNLTETNFVFGAALASDYQRKLDIVNRGFGGYNSNHGKLLIEPILKALTSVKLAVVFFGTNDSVIIPANDTVNVPIPQYEENIRYVIQKLREQNIEVILVGPAMVDENVGFEGTRTTAMKKIYCDVAEKLASELNLGFVGLWYAFAESVGWTPDKPLPGSETPGKTSEVAHLFSDGLHYSGKGYEIFYNELKKVIAQRYPQFVPEALPMKWPNWDEVDLLNPRQAFLDDKY